MTMRRTRWRGPSAWFVGAALLATVAWFGTIRAAATGEVMEVLVASNDLPVGADLAAESRVRLARIPADAVLTGMLTTVEQLGGRVTAVPLGAGEPITDASLGGALGRVPAPLAPGERAMSVPASAAGAALPVLVPGAQVDIVTSLGDRSGGQDVVRGAEVITTQLPDAGSGGAGEGAILLRLPEADALRLSGALDRGAGVRVLPRPAQEAVAR
jgi:Flp pilus assembly protein CpaB